MHSETQYGPSLGLRFRGDVRRYCQERTAPAWRELGELNNSELGAIIGDAKTYGQAIAAASDWVDQRSRQMVRREVD